MATAKKMSRLLPRSGFRPDISPIPKTARPILTVDDRSSCFVLFHDRIVGSGVLLLLGLLLVVVDHLAHGWFRIRIRLHFTVKVYHNIRPFRMGAQVHRRRKYTKTTLFAFDAADFSTDFRTRTRRALCPSAVGCEKRENASQSVPFGGWRS